MTETPSQLMDKYKWSAFIKTAGDDESLVRAALEEQVYSFGWNKDEAEGVVAGALASEEGIKKALEVYTGKYEDALEGMTAKDISTAYDDDLKSFLGEGSEKYQRAKGEFEKFRDEKYKDISKKLKKAKAINDHGKTIGLSDDDIKQAKDTLKKYAKVMFLISNLELNKLDALRPKIRKRATKSQLEAMLKE